MRRTLKVSTVRDWKCAYSRSSRASPDRKYFKPQIRPSSYYDEETFKGKSREEPGIK